MPETIPKFIPSGPLRPSIVISLSGYSNICLSDLSVKPFLKIFSNQKIRVSLWSGTVYKNELIAGDLVTSLIQH